MPFPEQTTKNYTRQRIEQLSPNQSGVYGIYKTNHWIYIGSGYIRARLLAHYNGDNPCITREQPTHWVDVLTPNYIAREKELIQEYSPACNQRVG